MGINVEMSVRGLCGNLDVGRVNDETTIQTIVDKIRKIILQEHPEHEYASKIKKGKKVALIAYDDELPNEKTIRDIMKEHNITSMADNFFYKTVYLVKP